MNTGSLVRLLPEYADAREFDRDTIYVVVGRDDTLSPEPARLLLEPQDDRHVAFEISERCVYGCPERRVMFEWNSEHPR